MILPAKDRRFRLSGLLLVAITLFSCRDAVAQHQKHCQKGCCDCTQEGCYDSVQKGKGAAYPEKPKFPFFHFCCPSAPPLAPVVQSQAVNSVPAVSNAQISLQVSADQRSPAESNQVAPEADQRGGPIQKTTSHGGSKSSDVEARLARLEQQITLLLQKRDRFTEDQDSVTGLALTDKSYE